MVRARRLSSRIHFALAFAAAAVGLHESALATQFGQSVSYTPGDVPAGLTDYEDSTVVGQPPAGQTGEQFGFPGVVSPFNPPFDTDQIVVVGQGGQITVQLPTTVTPGSGPQIGIFSNVGIEDANYSTGTAGPAPVQFFGGGTADVSVSQNGTTWSDLGLVNFTNPELYYLNSGPYDTVPPASPAVADFGSPFTGTIDSFANQSYSQIVATFNGSAGGSWLNLAGGGTAPVNFVRFSVPASLPPGTDVVLQAVSIGETQNAASTWTGAGSSWALSANWSNNVIPSNAQDTAVFTAATPSSITLDGAQTAGNLIFPSGASYTISSGSGGSLTLDNGPSPATIQGGGTITLATSPTVNGSLSIATGTTVDLLNNTLTINYLSPVNEPIAVQYAVASLTSAYAGGKWTGAGLTSSLAAANPARFSLGFADGNADSGTPAGPNQLLIQYTIAGDANLDGSVGFADLVAVAENFGATGQDWAHGDFTYDPNGSVGFADLVLVAENFGLSLNPPAELSLSPNWRQTAVVPEPASIALLLPLIALRRRRR